MTHGRRCLARIVCLVTSSLMCVSGIRAQEVGVDRPGSDLRHGFALPQADPGLCRQACDEDSQCRAYTYVKPGVQAGSAVCWLKHAVPPAVANDCCVSGIKPIVVLPPAAKAKPGVKTKPGVKAGPGAGGKAAACTQLAQKPERTFLSDGTVETRYPDGTIHRQRVGACGYTIIRPNGTQTVVQCSQVQRGDIPDLPADLLAREDVGAVLNAVANNLLDDIKSAVRNDAAVKNYLTLEKGKDLQDRIFLRLQALSALAL